LIVGKRRGSRRKNLVIVMKEWRWIVIVIGGWNLR
jgi:hypothetical protein